MLLIDLRCFQFQGTGANDVTDYRTDVTRRFGDAALLRLHSLEIAPSGIAEASRCVGLTD